MAKKTVLSQLTSAGENALEQLTANPMARRAVEGAMQAKDRVEKLVVGLADIDGRVSRLEKRLDALEKAKPKAATRARSTTSKPRKTTAKPKTPSS